MAQSNMPKSFCRLRKQVACLERLCSGCTWSVTKHSARTVNEKQINSLSGNFSGVTPGMWLLSSSQHLQLGLSLPDLPGPTRRRHSYHPFPMPGVPAAPSLWGAPAHPPCKFTTRLRVQWTTGFLCTLDGHPVQVKPVCLGSPLQICSFFSYGDRAALRY